MKSVLIISRSDNGIEPLAEHMKNVGYSDVTSVFSAQRAMTVYKEKAFDVIIINTPILNGDGVELSLRLSRLTSSGIFVLMKTNDYKEKHDMLEQNGIFAVQKPIDRVNFTQILKIWDVSRVRLGALEVENTRLKNQVEEIKIINRAKFALMQCLTMSEQQAHRYIEKQAMDMRISRLQVAQRVLSTYEL